MTSQVTAVTTRATYRGRVDLSPAATPDAVPGASFGGLLRAWRGRRRLSQQELSLAADVSARHLSFLETGRSRPSREMVLSLAEHLDVPLRERNELLTAAGFAPLYPRRDLGEPEMRAVRAAVDRVLASHAPWPAVAVDRRWDLVAANPPALVLAGAAAPALLVPPINVYRLTLHPEGLAPLLVNLPEVAHHLVDRLRRDVAATGDADLAALLAEVTRYPTVRGLPSAIGPSGGVVVPFRLRHPSGELAMFTTVTTFGTPADVTVAELALELFYPLDEVTAGRLDALTRAAR
jgi:transcriptional regulator with XRE-family HTH domain